MEIFPRRGMQGSSYSCWLTWTQTSKGLDFSLNPKISAICFFFFTLGEGDEDFYVLIQITAWNISEWP